MKGKMRVDGKPEDVWESVRLAFFAVLILYATHVLFWSGPLRFGVPSAEADIEISYMRSPQDSGQVQLLALASLSPPSAHILKPPKIQRKPEVPRYNFPKFRGKKGEEEYHPIIEEVAKQHDIDPALIKAMVMAESSYNPSAVSQMGAVGLMQLMPATAESLGAVNRFDPEDNVRAGVKYIKKLIDRLDGDLKAAIAAYNAGLGPVLRHKGVPPISATRYYVNKVLHYYNYYKKQEIEAARERKGKQAANDKPGKDGDEARGSIRDDVRIAQASR